MLTLEKNMSDADIKRKKNISKKYNNKGKIVE